MLFGNCVEPGLGQPKPSCHTSNVSFLLYGATRKHRQYKDPNKGTIRSTAYLLKVLRSCHGIASCPWAGPCSLSLVLVLFPLLLLSFLLLLFLLTVLLLVLFTIIGLGWFINVVSGLAVSAGSTFKKSKISKAHTGVVLKILGPLWL